MKFIEFSIFGKTLYIASAILLFGSVIGVLMGLFTHDYFMVKWSVGIFVLVAMCLALTTNKSV